jgi:hypothetical protein
MAEIDPVTFGELKAEVSYLKTEVTKLREDIETLLELANKSKGGFWTGMTIAATIGSVLTLIVTNISNFK